MQMRQTHISLWNHETTLSWYHRLSPAPDTIQKYKIICKFHRFDSFFSNYHVISHLTWPVRSLLLFEFRSLKLSFYIRFDGNQGEIKTSWEMVKEGNLMHRGKKGLWNLQGTLQSQSMSTIISFLYILSMVAIKVTHEKFFYDTVYYIKIFYLFYKI